MAAYRTLLVSLFAVAAPVVAAAQGRDPISPTLPLTLDQALQYAADHYPAIRAATEQLAAASAEVDVARAADLPRLDSLWQSARATANNIFGQVLPQSVIPSMSGPVLPTTSGQSVWGSAAGALFSWEPVDLGLRQAEVRSAQASVAAARANATLTELGVEDTVAETYLALLAAQGTVTATQADLDRRTVLLRAIQTLVTNELRPGADASRADAERAAAETRLLLAKQTEAVLQAALVRALGLTTGSVTIAGDALLARAPTADLQALPAANHPFVQVRQSATDQAEARAAVLGRTNLPRLYVQGSVFARGSGANPDGTFDGGASGLGLDRANWAAGVQILLPNVFGFASLHAEEASERATVRADTALRDEAVLTVTSEQRTAAALLQTTRAIAANTPVELSAARQSEAQARARYDAGLASIVEVADAERLLAQAEVEDQLARVDVWRALLASAAASGDLSRFITLVRQP